MVDKDIAVEERLSWVLELRLSVASGPVGNSHPAFRFSRSASVSCNNDLI